MRKKLFILVLLLLFLIPIVFAFRPSLSPSTFDWFSAFRDKIGYLDTNNTWTGTNIFTEDNKMFINLENHVNDTVYYRLNDTSDGLNLTNFTIKVRKGRTWVYEGDLI